MNSIIRSFTNTYSLNFHKNLIASNQNQTIFQISKKNFGSEGEKTCNTTTETDDLYKKVIVKVCGHDPTVLASYEKFVRATSNELNLNLKEVRTPHRFIERWSVLKSRFSQRKHMRQYEMRTHFKEFEFIHLTGSTCSTLLEYIQRNLPTGVAMDVHQTKISPLPEEFKANY